MGTPLAVIAKTQLKPIWRGKQRKRKGDDRGTKRQNQTSI